jgi:hypothetical protein
VWLIESLLFYMNETTVRNLLGFADALAVPRSLLDAHRGQGPLDLSNDAATSGSLRRARCLWTLRRQRPGALLAEYG